MDDWMFANRVRTRSEAIRQLIARGLTVPDEAPADAPEEPAPAPKKRSAATPAAPTKKPSRSKA